VLPPPTPVRRSRADPDRLRALDAYGLFDALPEPRFDRLTRLAARLLGMPVAAVCIMDARHLWYKSSVGGPFCALDLDEMPGGAIFCAEVTEMGRPLAVEDARLDPRFSCNPFVQQGHIGAYAGVPLRTSCGHVLGTLCVMDAAPRALDEDTLRLLEELAESVVAEVESSRRAAEAEAALTRARALHYGAEQILASTGGGLLALDLADVVTYANSVAEQQLGAAPGTLIGCTLTADRACDAARVLAPLVACAHATCGPVQDVCQHPETGRWLDVRVFPHDGGVRVSLDDVTERRRSEETLGLLRSAIGATTDAVAVLATADTPGDETIVYCNPALEALMGYDADELIGQPASRLDGPGTDARTVARLMAANRARRPVRAELLNYRKDGTPIWVELTLTPVFDDAGALRHWVSVRRDVTERLRTQEALAESREMYRLLAEQSGQLVYDYDVPTGTIMWSGHIERVTGCTAEAFAAVDIAGWEDRIHPDDRAAALGLLGAAMETATPYEVSYRFRHADGSYRHIFDRGVFLTDPDGQATRMLGTMADVTERHERQAALTLSETRYRALSRLISAYALAYEVGPDGRLEIAWVTDTVRDVTGYLPEESLALTPDETIHPDDWARWRRRNARVLAGEESMEEFRLRDKDGAYRWYRTLAFPEMADGRVVRVWVAVQDVHDQKRTEEALIAARDEAEEAVRLKDAFLANMSHEIRTPLTGIIGFTELLRDEVPEHLHELTDVIEAGGRRLMDTLGSVLELAQIQAGRRTLACVDVDLAALVRETTDLMQVQARTLGLVLDTHGADTPCIVEGDAGALTRVLTNLVGNALKFTAQGRVDVTLRRDGPQAVLSVRDTGVGIGAEFLPHLFDEFRQESTGLARSHEGAGLGLAITRRLLDLMKGTVEVQSEKGRGSTFTVRLPLAR
jgi:PAS domain S-box-containing protein